ncbi:MAG: alkaline phosphatase [Pseudomonadota bacterium]
MRVRASVLAIVGVLFGGCAATPTPAIEEPPPLVVDASIQHRLDVQVNTKTARNVILFIGDGMGVATVTAARIYAGQERGESGEENALSFEKMPHLALLKTYTTNSQVSDSAGTATAMLTGIKTRSGVINVAPNVARGDCANAHRNRLESLARQAETRGMLTGVISTARITHATPAAVYAVSPERNYESDRDIPISARNECADIARQLIGFNAGDGLDVVLGGGYSEFVGTALGGDRVREDDNLVAKWLAAARGRQFLSTREELAAASTRGQWFGLFSRSHLSFEVQRATDSAQPSLTDMTMRALDWFADKEDGYFLVVEAGRIDHAHHAARAGVALAETVEFARAIDQTLARVDTADTLVLVTADHSHTLNIGGYPTRGNPILGLVTTNDARGEPKAQPELAADGQPYTTLTYANGPGAPAAPRARPRPETGLAAVQQAAIPTGSRGLDGRFRGSETHGGVDVALYAVGPWSHLVGGVLEQNAVYHIMRHALGFDRPTE